MVDLLQWQIIFYVISIKVLRPQQKNLPKVLSLSNSIEMITALANDESYKKYLEQLMNYSNSEIASLFFRVQENQKYFEYYEIC